MALHADNGELALLPVLVYGEVAHGLQAMHMTLCLPCRGHCGKELQGVGVALQKHLGNTGTATEVAINLEWRMSIVEVVVNTTGILVQTIVGRMAQSVLQDQVCMVTIQGTCPKVYLPSH